jgi:hypothetical protein
VTVAHVSVDEIVPFDGLMFRFINMEMVASEEFLSTYDFKLNSAIADHEQGYKICRCVA